MWPFARRQQTHRTTAVHPAVDAVKAPGKGFTHGLPADLFLRDAGRLDEIMARSVQRSHAELSSVGIAMDADHRIAMDNSIQQVKSYAAGNKGFLPLHVLEWYSNQGFLGWQILAVLAQNWLVNKACAMPGRDAVRNGFERTANDGEDVDPKEFAKLRKLDRKFRLPQNLREHHKFARVFGLRHTLFLVDGLDYEAPFNADGVKPGSYRGMTQIDPYWLAPMFDGPDAADPASPNFYNPTWWMVNGKKVHRSHFVISRNGNELADILKPTYFYGGLSTAQLIFSRVYGAERTANEAPLLAMTKRLFTLTTDTTKAMADLPAFQARLEDWLAFLNNFGCKVIGDDEQLGQIDTSLAGLMETITTQYELVAAVADVPAAKLMGTSPKAGLGSEGGYEIASYHEFLESVQEDELTPIVDRHTLLCQLSEGIAPGVMLETHWLPVAASTTVELADVNLKRAQSDAALVETGAIDYLDVRRRLIADRDSGYNGIEEEVDPPEDDGDDTPDGGGEDPEDND